jgi:hypothetical protein
MAAVSSIVSSTVSSIVWRVAAVTLAWGVFFVVYGRGPLAWAGAVVLGSSAGVLACCLGSWLVKRPYS